MSQVWRRMLPTTRVESPADAAKGPATSTRERDHRPYPEGAIQGRLKKRMKISGIYRPEVVTAELSDNVSRAARRMRLHEISALPVVQHERLVGIVTERDITRAVAEEMDPNTATVADIMTQHPLVATPNEDAQAVATRMLEHGIRHLPVVDGHRLLGVISARDLLMLEAWQPPI